mmetsp:Transcript_2724/g.5894  ORF Transcript_2724/g.5894 Transcript_2724/m.5894 type:complete len:221 (-) Transcript_2724:293-955(-)
MTDTLGMTTATKITSIVGKIDTVDVNRHLLQVGSSNLLETRRGDRREVCRGVGARHVPLPAVNVASCQHQARTMNPAIHLEKDVGRLRARSSITVILFGQTGAIQTSHVVDHHQWERSRHVAGAVQDRHRKTTSTMIISSGRLQVLAPHLGTGSREVDHLRVLYHLRQTVSRRLLLCHIEVPDREIQRTLIVEKARQRNHRVVVGKRRSWVQRRGKRKVM